MMYLFMNINQYFATNPWHHQKRWRLCIEDVTRSIWRHKLIIQTQPIGVLLNDNKTCKNQWTKKTQNGENQTRHQNFFKPAKEKPLLFRKIAYFSAKNAIFPLSNLKLSEKTNRFMWQPLIIVFTVMESRIRP